ncbi:hypothetical protein GEMRC1_011585 [Eukaryota sp. GEM-RC1]
MDQLQQLFPDRQALWAQIKDLQQKKLWYQLTVLLDQILSQPIMSEFNNCLVLYRSAILPNESNLSPLKLSQMLITITKRASDYTEAFNFLKPYTQTLKASPVPYTLILLHLAHIQILRSLQGTPMESDTSTDDFINKTPKELLNMAADIIDKQNIAAFPENNKVLAKFHQVQAELCRTTDYSSFVRHILDYLAYTDSPTRDYGDVSILAQDLCIAALCSPDVYNFSDIVTNPIMEHLSCEYVRKLLGVFTTGDVNGFNALVKEKILISDPRLDESKDVLTLKVKILGIMEIAFSKPVSDRSISFTEISTRCGIDLNEVFHLLIKVMSLGLVTGDVDAIDKRVSIRSVQPRSLGFTQIETLARHLDKWMKSVETAADMGTSTEVLPEELIIVGTAMTQ